MAVYGLAIARTRACPLWGAKIVPIFKSGERNLISNYKPISVLSCLSKIVEKVVILQLTEFSKVNNVITSRQFGFRGGLSADNAKHVFVPW